MIVIFLLILLSLLMAGAFLTCFIWSVRSGQYEDTCTPSMRVLVEDRVAIVTSGSPKPFEKPRDQHER